MGDLVSKPTDNDFQGSGLSRLSTVDWQNERHRRSIMASLVKGVYVLEDDRQEKRQGHRALAPPWWKFFDFQLQEELIDDAGLSIFADSSTFGAVYEFKPKPNNYYPKGAPKYVIAFRGTMLKKDTIIRDMMLNINILISRLSHRSRYDKAMQPVENIVSGEGVSVSDIWLAGHSLGAAIALLVGRNMAKKGNFIESYFFNPPFFATPMKRRIYVASSWLKAALTVIIKDNEERRHSEDLFYGLCKWEPKLFLHKSDLICAGFIPHFEVPETMESYGVGDVGRLASQSSFMRLFMYAFGMEDYSEELHLLPSACLTTSFTSKLKAHSLNQWLTDESVSDSKVYSMCTATNYEAPKPATNQANNPYKSATSHPHLKDVLGYARASTTQFTTSSFVGTSYTMFEKIADVSTLYGCANFELVYHFWVPPEHKGFYTHIVETFGHIPTPAVLPEVNTLVTVTRVLLDAAFEMTNLGESFPSEEKLSSRRCVLDHARFLQFNISWLEELLKEIEKKRDSLQELLLVEISQLKEGVKIFNWRSKEHSATQMRLVQEAAEVEVNFVKGIYFGSYLRKNLTRIR